MLLTEDNARAVRHIVHRAMTEIKMAHVTEAVASAYGFNSHAALLAYVRDNDSRDASFDRDQFVSRLAALTGLNAARLLKRVPSTLV